MRVKLVLLTLLLMVFLLQAAQAACPLPPQFTRFCPQSTPFLLPFIIGSGGGASNASNNQTINSMALGSAYFVPGSAGALVGGGQASVVMSTGSFSGTWSIQTTGTDVNATPCGSYGTDLTINSSSGVVSNSATGQGTYPALCVVATQTGVTNSPYVQAFSVEGGFVVATAGSSPAGSDSNAGTLAAPFLTPGKCQTSMVASGVNKTCYIRSGTYTTSSSAGSCTVTGGGTDALILGASDAGETWSYYPPDGYNSATITSGGVLTTGWCINSGASTITINGLKFAGFTTNDIISRAVITVQNSEFTGITDTSCCDRAAILVSWTGATISHNYFHDLSGIGIDLGSGYSGGTFPAFSNATVSNNFFLNTCSGVQDCGAIYCFDHGTTYSSNIAFTNNYIRDVFKSGGGGVTLSGQGIYFDEGCSNVTAKGNVVTGFLSDCFFNHGGAGDIVQGNICDIEFTGTPSPQPAFMAYQWISTPGGGAGAGNVASGNIITANNSTTNSGVFVECRVSTWTNPLQVNPVSQPTASDFFNFGSGTVSHGVFNCGSAGVNVTDSGDTNPQNVNPVMACTGSYPTASALFSSPVSFPTMPTGWDTAGFWGPPGFVDPLTGNAPSWNPTFSCR